MEASRLVSDIFNKEDCIASIESQGFYIFEHFLSQQHLGQLQQAFDVRMRLADGEVDLGCDWRDETVKPFMRVLQDERLLDILFNICGFPLVALRLELFCKGPFSETAIPWHQDTFTTHTHFTWGPDHDPTNTQSHPITLWVALDDVSCNNGGMEMVPGRHKEIFNLAGSIPDVQLKDSPKVQYKMFAGQAGLHHPLVPHRSVVNRTSGSRRAFLIRFSPWTSGLQRKCGNIEDLITTNTTQDRPSWYSNPSGRYVWMPGHATALKKEKSLNRILVCCQLSENLDSRNVEPDD